MKDILIAVAPYREEHREICKTLSEELQRVCIKPEASLQQVLYTAWIISGPKSFDIASVYCDKINQHGLPVALFELESVLHSPEVSTEGNPK